MSETSVQQENLPDANKPQSLQLMRWFLLFTALIWLIVAIVAAVIVFCDTKNPFSFSLVTTLAPPTYILHRITKYLFRDSFDLKMEALKQLKSINVCQIIKDDP